MASQPCVVLVTGGAGFVGQHVVGLLQTRADHVTEIRVLDVEPYENKLDYVHKKPLRSIVGSITDEGTLEEALQDVHSVIHIAGIADSSMFPNNKRVIDINVTGTLVTTLAALRSTSVKRLINCSSTSLGIGYDNDVTGVIRETDRLPREFIFEPYASSKLAGERIALSAHSDCLRTVSLRPLVMYGELDVVYVTQTQLMASKTCDTLYTMDCRGVPQQQAYVGNVAWAFVCAETTLHKQEVTPTCDALGNADVTSQPTTATIQEHEDQKEKDVNEICRKLQQIASDYVTGKAAEAGTSQGDPECPGTNTDGCELASDRAYYIVDDTQPRPPFEFQAPFLLASGFKMSGFSIPIPVFMVVFFMLYWFMRLVRLFNRTANYPVSIGAIRYLRRSFIFSADKAGEELGYSPIYSPDQAQERSMPYYINNPYVPRTSKKHT